MVLGTIMKKIIFLIVGAVLGLLCGALASIPFNYWYATNFVRADEDANFLVSTLVFGFLPVFVVIGAYIGIRLFNRKAGR